MEVAVLHIAAWGGDGMCGGDMGSKEGQRGVYVDSQDLTCVMRGCNATCNATQCKRHEMCGVGGVVLCADRVGVEDRLGVECGGVVLFQLCRGLYNT